MYANRPVTSLTGYTSDKRSPPPTSAQLLARIVPLSGRGSGGLGRRYPRYQPLVIPIYRDRVR